MALLKFLKGNYAGLSTKAIAEGQILICGDTGEMFVDVAADKRVKIGDFTIVANTSALDALDASTIPTTRLYYVEEGNILARFNGTTWSQINKQLTTDQIKTMIGLADYELKTDAAQKLTDAKDYTDTEVAKVQDALNDLEVYVGTIPVDDEGNAVAASVVAYVDKKTEGIATDTALAELQGKVTALEEANAEGGSVATAIADAQKAADDAQATADSKATLDQVKELDYATKAEAQGYADAKDDAIAAAKKAGDDAQADVDALELKVGTVEDGKTVVGMIGDAQSAADDAQADVDALAGKVGTVAEGKTIVGMIGEAQAAANSKVASVSAKDASIVIGGEATAPTVGVQISAEAGNILSLANDGLKAIVPAAAEYTIVKAADSGDYAAVYNLTKDGAIVGASINIPKDMVVKSGSVVGDEIVLVLNDESATEIKIPVASLIEYVTSGSQTGDMVVINVSDDHKVTATITDGTITAAKLSTDVQTALNKAHEHANKEELDKIVIGDKAKWDAMEQNAKDYADQKNDAMNERVEALEAIDHEHANKELLDTYTQTEANLADAVAKKHEHTNAAELAKIADGDVAKWNAVEQNAKDYADTKDDAIEAAKAAADAAQDDIDAFQETYAIDKAALDKSISDNSAAIETKANSADVYAKTETYTQEEVDNAIAAAVEAQMSWGTFGE